MVLFCGQGDPHGHSHDHGNGGGHSHHDHGDTEPDQEHVHEKETGKKENESKRSPKAKHAHDEDHDQNHGEHDHDDKDHDHDHDHDHGEDNHPLEVDDDANQKNPANKPKARGSSTMYSVFLHVIGDAMGSIAVIVATLIIWLTNWSWKYYVDPIASLFVAAILAYGSFGLVRRMVYVVMQASPSSIDVDSIRASLKNIQGVIDVHDLHFWSLDESRIVASVHIVCTNMSAFKKISKRVRKVLHANGVHASSVQPEFTSRETGGTPLISDCRAACVSDDCLDLHCCSSEVKKRSAKVDAHADV
eukprot:TRINITY_DN1111_c0_g1_i1.p1 TRINITY_DN1111_c0_g1~~TRINITY_DN1111_c0_g1_i1.p1  ORF type:complete len:303 (+),score=27.66 TRINITY_DN1111_c0_g1_i1:497-1405(+)